MTGRRKAVAAAVLAAILTLATALTLVVALPASAWGTCKAPTTWWCSGYAETVADRRACISCAGHYNPSIR